VEGSRRALRATGVAAIIAAGLVAGCGGGERQDANEPSGTFKVKVLKASFPEHQRLANAAVMRVVVRNDSGKTIPNVAVTVTSDDDAKGGAGFTTRSTAADLADSTRQLWIVDKGPRGGDTAYVSTWALGPLAARRTQTFEWHVTPVVAGTHLLRWHVAAGLNGKAVARTANGQDAAGIFRVRVASKPAPVTVDPKTGDIVSASDSSS
jgi:ABC-type glycerol-3-phosphate transport system substrate-binding protein